MEQTSMNSLLLAQSRLNKLKSQLQKPMAAGNLKTYFSALQYNLDVLEKGIGNENNNNRMLPGISKEEAGKYRPVRREQFTQVSKRRAVKNESIGGKGISWKDPKEEDMNWA